MAVQPQHKSLDTANTIAVNMTTERVTDRPLLQFAEEVKTRFAFLEGSGFHCVRTEVTFVRYESSRIGINVYHGRRSFEIGLEIGSTSSPTEVYSFPEILRLADHQQGEQYKYYAAHTTQGVAEGVTKLAELFRHYVAGGILNDPQLFVHLKVQREEIAKNYALEVALRQARRAAESAWPKKNYVAIVEALQPLRTYLTAAEVAKLEFAKKRLGKC